MSEILKITDLENGLLKVNLSDLITLFYEDASSAVWLVKPVKLQDGYEYFEVTGVLKDQFEQIANSNELIGGNDLFELVQNTVQVIWGEFHAFTEEGADKAFVIIRAIDSTFYEIETSDEDLRGLIKSNYQNVEIVDQSFAVCDE